MKASEFDKIFDEGKEDIVDYLDLNTIKRRGTEQKRVNVDFPVWMIKELDEESIRLGVPRQSLIKVWIAERLEDRKPKRRKKRAANKSAEVTA